MKFKKMKTLRYWTRFLFYLAIALIIVQIRLMYKWNWICTNFEPQLHVNKMCSLYENGLAEGTLCGPICESKDALLLSCNTHYSTKETIFTTTWNNIRLIFKSVISDIPALHWYDNGVLKYPSEKEFQSTIRAITRNMLNYTLPNDIILKLAQIKPKQKEFDIKQRHIEMDNIWVLIQDNEYLLSTAYENKNIFPKILGTCGPYFGVQYVKSLPQPFSIFYDKDVKENWYQNLKYSIMVLDLLEELDNNFKEPLHLCDVKVSDFGITDLENGRAKILDLDLVYPKSVVNRFIKEINNCQKDEDCKFFDCRGRCNKQARKCNSVVSNNNLQIVCEKIFLGWRMSNTILLPGLLLSKYAPDDLMVVLRQCANPENENIIPRGAAHEDIRKQLYTILVEIEQGANGDSYN